MNQAKLVPCLIAVLAATLLPTAVQAQAVAPIHQLVFTEESSTLLTATLDGGAVGTVINTAPDRWTWNTVFDPVTPPIISINVSAIGPFTWEEPGADPGNNALTSITINFGVTQTTMAWTLTSDHVNTGSPVPDGALGGTFFLAANTLTLFGPAQVYFHDLSDQGTSVPDQGRTLGMLFIAALGTFGAARLRVQAA